MVTKKQIAVVGGSELTAKKEDLSIAFNLGKALIDNNYRIISGGKGGVMREVFKGARSSKNYTDGLTVGIVPSSSISEANNYCDVVIATGIGIARNLVIINSADAVIAIGGGSGTLSEMALAWQMNKLIFAFNTEGWSKKLGNTILDNKRTDKIILIDSIDELIEKLHKKLK